MDDELPAAKRQKIGEWQLECCELPPDVQKRIFEEVVTKQFFATLTANLKTSSSKRKDARALVSGILKRGGVIAGGCMLQAATDLISEDNLLPSRDIDIWADAAEYSEDCPLMLFLEKYGSLVGSDERSKSFDDSDDERQAEEAQQMMVKEEGVIESFDFEVVKKEFSIQLHWVDLSLDQLTWFGAPLRPNATRTEKLLAFVSSHFDFAQCTWLTLSLNNLTRIVLYPGEGISFSLAVKVLFNRKLWVNVHIDWRNRKLCDRAHKYLQRVVDAQKRGLVDSQSDGPDFIIPQTDYNDDFLPVWNKLTTRTYSTPIPIRMVRGFLLYRQLISDVPIGFLFRVLARLRMRRVFKYQLRHYTAMQFQQLDQETLTNSTRAYLLGQIHLLSKKALDEVRNKLVGREREAQMQLEKLEAVARKNDVL